MKLLRFLLCLVIVIQRLCSLAIAEERRYFAIQIVDDTTGRGVPLVELETINHLSFVTDSHGIISLAEPDLFEQTVYFTIRSHGYEFPKDGFGFQGKALQIKPGGKAVLKIKRTNIAERLYRLTGSGIYRDTVLLGGDVPIDKPLLNAEVFGCDSVMATVYQGKIHWFWGDTTKSYYPLGSNFHVSGATSRLPQNGGLPPETGVQFAYFVEDNGSVRPMAKMLGEGPTWISEVTVLKDAENRERMYAGYVKIRNQLESYRWGFVVWNDKMQQFDEVVSFDQRPNIFLEPQAHTFLLNTEGGEYVYFSNPLPLTRVVANPTAFADPIRYEGFTCLKAGTRLVDKQLDRDDGGRLRYAWKANTPPLTQADQVMLVRSGVMKAEETLIALQDVETGRPVHAHSGSVYWNEYRKRWVLITVEANGNSSILGEVWFAEADNPTGPWAFARKVVTHDRYSFYNPKHHPFFDEAGGRVIYFEGTYTHTFSGNPKPTPRYDYNQIMYRLDLSDSLLNLPVAYYKTQDSRFFATKQSGQEIAFYALEHPGANTVAAIRKGNSLQFGASKNQEAAVLFHALPSSMNTSPTKTTPLYEFIHAKSGDRVYTTEQDWEKPGFRRNPEPVCRVWNPR